MKKNKKGFKKALKYIAGGVNSPVRAFNSVRGDPIFIKFAKGAYIIDLEDKAYIDFVQSWGPLILGHCDKDVQAACVKALKKGASYGAPTMIETKLAKFILQDFPHLDKIRFVSSGTEATMSAIRLARAFSKKDKFIKFQGCYHGHSDALLVSAGSGAATFNTPSSLGVPKDFVKHTLVAKYNDIESVKELFHKHKDIGCVIIEPIAGNMGLVPARKDFLKELIKIAHDNEALVIFDEVMSGFRASYTGSFEIYDLKADIITFGKVIGGGLPAAAFASRDEIMQLLSPQGGVYQAGTLSGNPLAMAAGLATLKKIRKNPHFYEELEYLGGLFTQGLASLAKDRGLPLQTSLVGSMFGFFFNESEVYDYNTAANSNLELFKAFHEKMLENGVYLAPSMYESAFICKKMNESIIERALNAAKKSFASL